MKTIISYLLSSARLALVCLALIYLSTYAATTALGSTPATVTDTDKGERSQADKVAYWLNFADESELQEVKGIGSTIAARIIAARKDKAFTSGPDCKARVKGIGATILKRIRSHVREINKQG